MTKNHRENAQHGKISTILQDKDILFWMCLAAADNLPSCIRGKLYCSPLPAQYYTSTSQHLPCRCSSESVALRRPCRGHTSEIQPLMGKAETSSVLGQLLRTADTRQTAVRGSAAGRKSHEWESNTVLVQSHLSRALTERTTSTHGATETQEFTWDTMIYN